MNGDPRNAAPSLVHRLGVALRFLDAFTRAPVLVPLEVSIPAQRWRAVRREPDAMYLFLATNAPVPAGLLDVEVEAPGGEYVSLERVQVQLPPPAAPHPPPARREDFLVQPRLWPTPRFRPPGGETVVLGRVVSTGATTPTAGLRVVLFVAPGPAPAGLFTRTDDRGEFLFRFPDLKRQVSGTSVVSSRALGIEIRDASPTALTVTPAGTFAVPLGQVTVMTFGVP